MDLEFSGEIWYWRGPAPFYFVTVPEPQSLDLAAASPAVTYGWGMIPTTVRIGATQWDTALWPKDGTYVVPIKVAVRKKENLQLGDVVDVQLMLARVTAAADRLLEIGVLILLPASDAKRPVERGRPVDLATLSFPQLTSTRVAVLDALVEVSAGPNAASDLCVPSTMTDVVRRNVGLRDAPATSVESLYGGVLHDAIGFSDLDAGSRRRARSWIVVISALWGALRLSDRVPSYRLDMCGRLPGLAHLTDVWREPLGDVLPGAARRGIVVDFRSSEYFTAWRPAGELAERTVLMRVMRDDDTSRGAGSHSAKRTRGLVVRRIVTDAIDARHPEELAEALSAHFSVDLCEPDHSGRSWELRVVEAAD